MIPLLAYIAGLLLGTLMAHCSWRWHLKRAWVYVHVTNACDHLLLKRREITRSQYNSNTRELIIHASDTTVYTISDVSAASADQFAQVVKGGAQ